jgi:phage repressor protein C with HTH and peptisase S24 domain/plasmid maintenance system antidote protein VapI
MTDIEIIAKVAEYTGLSFNKLAKEIGLTSPQTFYDIKAGKHGISKELAEKIHARYLNINEAWLLTGNGEMLVAENAATRITEMVVVGSTEEIAVDIEALQNDLNITTSQLATIINDSEEYLLKCQGKLLPRHIVALELNYGEERISKYVTLPNEGMQVEVVESFPVLPEEVTTSPNTDIVKYVEENGSELETINPNQLLNDAKVDVAERIKRTSMLPTFQPDDTVFIRFIKDKMKIVDGETYYLDCKNRPTMIRLVKFEGCDKLRLIAKNSQYGDIVIDRTDIINIGVVVALFRMTFGDQYSELEALRREKDTEREKKDSQIDKMLEMMDKQAEQQNKLIDFITKDK